MERLELMSSQELLQEYRNGNSAALSILTLLALDGDEESQAVMCELESDQDITQSVHTTDAKPVITEL